MDARAAQRVQFRIMTLVEGQHAGTPIIMVPWQAVAACVSGCRSSVARGWCTRCFQTLVVLAGANPRDSRRSPIMAQQIGALHQQSIDLEERLDDDEASSEQSSPSSLRGGRRRWTLVNQHQSLASMTSRRTALLPQPPFQHVVAHSLLSPKTAQVSPAGNFGISDITANRTTTTTCLISRLW